MSRENIALMLDNTEHHAEIMYSHTPAPTPVDQPLQNFCYEVKVGLPKVLHGYHPGVAQGAHHLGEVWRGETKQTRNE